MLTGAILIILCGFCGVLLYRYVQQWTRTLALVKDLDGPKAYPLIGSALAFVNKSPVEFLQTFNTFASRFRSPTKFWLGPWLAIYVGEPELVEEVLASAQWNVKSDEYRYLQPWLGQGLLTSSGEKWHQRRKALTPTFHFKILEHFVEVFERRTSSLIEKLHAHAATGESFDIFPYVLLYALDVICETAMGTSIDALEQSDSEYVRAVRTAAGVAMTRMFDLLMKSPFFYLTPSYFRQRKALKVLHAYTDRIIATRRTELQRTHGRPSDGDGDVGMKKRLAFLDLLLGLTIDGRPLSDSDIREEVDTFMFEGHDTTTSAISFALWRLAKHPEVQLKVWHECQEVLGNDPNRPVTLGDLQRLHYLELVIKETLRLYPSVPIIARKSTAEVTLGGKTIPAGTTVIVGVYQMGRDERHFPEPLEFRPERFTTETSVDRANPYRYVPFSAGPRNCIGQKFAMNEMKSVMAAMVRHFELVLPADAPEFALGTELILKPYPGVFLQLKRRGS
uniref:Cytochrome P450 n=1 Tax=Anopheles farauti TaxID=69004 RepID=A0A182Q961_9DIPT